MIIKNVALKNFAGCKHVSVNFDEKLTYLIGPNGSNKSTVGLNGIWFIMQSVSSKKSATSKPLMGDRFLFVGPDGGAAEGELTLKDVEKDIEIIVKRKITEKGQTKLSFIGPEDMVLDQAYLDKLFSVFMIAPKAFMDLPGKDQALVLGLNVDQFNTELKGLKEKYTVLNSAYLGYGNEPEPEKVEAVDFTKLSKQKDRTVEFNSREDEKEAARKDKEEEISELGSELKELERKVEEKRLEVLKAEKELEDLPEAEERLSLEDIQDKIDNATETNRKASLYTSWEETNTKKSATKEKMVENKEAQARVVERKNKYLQEKELPFDELSINDDGELLYNERPLKEPYFSSGELIKIIPIIMSSQNPELKYVFIQQFNLLDDANQQDVIEYLTSRDLQLCIEWVGERAFEDGHSIIMSEVE
jgi:chromosome segregation ATPase